MGSWPSVVAPRTFVEPCLSQRPVNCAEIQTSMSQGQSSRFAGWPLVQWCALGLVALTAAQLAVRGLGEEGLRLVIRTTAKTSLALFTSAFIASAVARMWPHPLSRWLLRNRRYLGVSFAVSHGIHLLAILAVLRISPTFKIAPATVVGGGLAYVFIAAMTATSFDRSAAWIGPRAWQLLHTAGVYYVWFIFFISYAPRAAIESLWYTPFVLVLLASLGLRLAVRRRSRQHGRIVLAASPRR
jgi:methionine sulfoxide reductase heme-binding subunit